MSTEGNLAGRLRQRITLQQKVLTPDAGGGASIAWQDVTTLWAEVMPMRSFEPLQHDKLQLKNIFRVTIRYRSDITADKRFLYEGRVLEITGVADMDARKQALEITAGEEV